jgi:Zn-finger nucleic acid-binding protein
MSPDAASLHCPNCGAAAAPGAASCPYCHATLATVSCPKCFGLMFAGALFCPSCGARRQRTEGVGEHRCVACPGMMKDVRIGDAPMLECGSCGASWLDVDTFDRICASSEARAAVLARPQAVRTQAAGVHYRKCVACGKLMNRVNFSRVSGTIIDVCKGHGVLLDAGELQAVVTFIEGGGLDRARQRQLDDLKEEEQRLRALQSQPAPFAPSDVDSSRELDLMRALDQFIRRA